MKNVKVITLVIAVLLLGVVIGVLIDKNNTQPKTTDELPEYMQGATQKLPEKNMGNESSSNDSDEEQPNQADSSATVEITNVFQQDDGSLVVQTALRNIASGQCKLDVIMSGQTITKTADILYQPQFSTCQGFSISASELPDGADATIKITIIQEGNVIESAETAYEVER